MRLHRIARSLVLLVTVAGLTLVSVSPAVAAPPPNDDFDNATVVPEPLPFTHTVDTREATTAPDDPDCEGSGPTVWYSFTPSDDITVEANTFGSNYDTTLSAYLGSRGELEQIACSDDAAFTPQSRVRLAADAGVTVFFMVGAFDSGPGGDLVFNVRVGLELRLAIDPVGTVNPREGIPTVTGTAFCSREGGVLLLGHIEQRRGHMDSRAFFHDSFFCAGEETWTGAGQLERGAFLPGRATVTVEAFLSDEDADEVAVDEETATVRLRPVRG